MGRCFQGAAYFLLLRERGGDRACVCNPGFWCESHHPGVMIVRAWKTLLKYWADLVRDLVRACGFSTLVAALHFLMCKLLNYKLNFSFSIKTKQPYSGSHSESVSSHMEIFMRKSKLIKLWVWDTSKAMSFLGSGAWFWKDSRPVLCHL